MRAVVLVLLLTGVACELEGPEDKRRDGETFAEAEARHAAERAPADPHQGREAKPEARAEVTPGQTELEARRDGDGVLVHYRGWLTCDGNYELRPSGVPGDALRLVIVDRNTSSQRVSCAGAVELHARIPQAPHAATSVRVDQGRGYREVTARIQ